VNPGEGEGRKKQREAVPENCWTSLIAQKAGLLACSRGCLLASIASAGFFAFLALVCLVLLCFCSVPQLLCIYTLHTWSSDSSAYNLSTSWGRKLPWGPDSLEEENETLLVGSLPFHLDQAVDLRTWRTPLALHLETSSNILIHLHVTTLYGYTFPFTFRTEQFTSTTKEIGLFPDIVAILICFHFSSIESRSECWLRLQNTITPLTFSISPHQAAHTKELRINLACIRSGSDPTPIFRIQQEPGTMAVPNYCHHSFNLLKSESTLIQWVCSMCHSGPHWYIFECKYCKLKTCRPCTNKV